MARPTKEAARARDTVLAVTDLEDWVTKYAPDARKTLMDIMLDKSASATNRKGVAETILRLQAEFYKRRKGAAELTVEEADSIDRRDEVEENDGFPVMKLAYEG